MIGSVRRPAIYELRDRETSLQRALELALGPRFDADKSRTQIEHIEGGSIRLRDVDLETERLADVIVSDGNIVTVAAVVPRLMNAVYLSGNVARPGRYQWRAGMRVSDLLRSPDDLVNPEFWQSRRADSLSNALESSDSALEPPDIAFETSDGESKPVDLSASEDTEEGSLRSLLQMPVPYWELAIVRRIDPKTVQEQLHPFNLRRAIIDRDPTENLLLVPGDTIVVFDERTFRPTPLVKSAGALERPGAFPFRDGLTVRDIIALSGGLKREAYLKSAELSRIILTKTGAETKRISVDLEQALAGDPKSNVMLQRMDSLFVRTIPEFRPQDVVTLKGEVRFPGEYTVVPNERLSSLIKRAGGFTEDAYLRGTVFLRESARALQQERINDMIRELKAGVGKSISENVGAIRDTKIQAAAAEVAAKRARQLRKLQSFKARGRIQINVRPLEELRFTADDMVLEDKDRIHIPIVPRTVNVMGSVYQQTVLVWRENMTVGDYIDLCGGATRDADQKRIYVIGCDGTVVSRAMKRLGGYKWHREQRRWAKRDLLCALLGPGDTVVVPENLDPTVYPGKVAKDVIELIYQISLSAAIVTGAF